jgi:hypothetical protein
MAFITLPVPAALATLADIAALAQALPVPAWTVSRGAAEIAKRTARAIDEVRPQEVVDSLDLNLARRMDTFVADYAACPPPARARIERAALRLSLTVVDGGR